MLQLCDWRGAILPAFQVEMKALDELTAQKLPRLAQHMTDLEVDISILATDWYLTLFAASMPAETVARVWDGLFNEGPKVVFRTALALLKSQEAALLRYDNAGEELVMVPAVLLVVKSTYASV